MTAQKTISTVDPADWATIWQSELAALAVDPEATEAAVLWGQAWIAAGNAASGHAGTDAAAGAAPAHVAPCPERPRGHGG